MIVTLIVPMGRSVLTSSGGKVAVVRFRGPIDAACSLALDHTARQLSLLGPQTVFVDLEAVTDAPAPLTSFLAALPLTLPREADLLVCKASPVVQQLIAAHCPQLLAFVHDIPAPFGTTRKRIED